MFTRDMPTIRIVVVAFVAVGLLVGLSACNTTAGLGQDVTATGTAVTKAAEKAKP